jgi:mRNA-degrading endonuclease RelE of RelBE toxin-antitoxin system
MREVPRPFKMRACVALTSGRVDRLYANGVLLRQVDAKRAPMTVQELPGFAKEAERLLSERSHEQLIEFLGLNPQAGAIIRETGGIRKLRWFGSGRGKRGGVRVIYYFHSEKLPLLALDIYGKNERENLTASRKSS